MFVIKSLDAAKFNIKHHRVFWEVFLEFMNKGAIYIPMKLCHLVCPKYTYVLWNYTFISFTALFSLGKYHKDIPSYF